MPSRYDIICTVGKEYLVKNMNLATKKNLAIMVKTLTL